jgi:hypothetical protein
MGLLDDAIREHLELKRLHGADAGEVARQEHEALGPVRREDIAIPDPHAPEVAFREDVGPAEVATAPEPSVTPPPAAAAPTADGPPASAPPAAAAPVAAEPEPPSDAGQETVAFSLDDLKAAEATAKSPPEPVWEEPAAPPPAPAEPQTVAPDVVPADEEPGEHDELEETPEFLQETPEHDRLWFEQKPPRDFDF